MNTMTEIRNILLDIKNRLMLHYPHTNDADANYAGKHTVPASSTLTLNFTISRDFLVVIHQLYADLVADCTYIWWTKGEGTTTNDINYVRPLLLLDSDTLRLIVTNTATSTRSIDVVVRAFGISRSV